MSKKTIGEVHFEMFCGDHGLVFERVPEKDTPTPDYRLFLNGVTHYIEIKQIDEDINFRGPVRTRTVGAHVRAKINEARKQTRVAASESVPGILLIYNNLDPQQQFGTESHDFIAAMYGELTVALDRSSGEIIDSYNGRNRSFREDKNDSFSAIGRIFASPNGTLVDLYENIHAKNPIDYSVVPNFIKVTRFESSGTQWA